MSRRVSTVKSCLISAIVLGLLALPHMAQAADHGNYNSWDGFYIGGHVGYGYFDAENAGAGQTRSQDTHGLIGGAFVGYNVDLGDLVLGIELDTAFGDLSDDTVIVGLGKVHVANHGQHTARIRAGWDMGSVLLYATGGLAMSDIWLDAPGPSDEHFLWGGVVGAGIEAKITENIVARAEYLYAIYGEQTYQLVSPVTVDYQTHSVRAGIGWLF